MAVFKVSRSYCRQPSIQICYNCRLRLILRRMYIIQKITIITKIIITITITISHTIIIIYKIMMQQQLTTQQVRQISAAVAVLLYQIHQYATSVIVVIVAAIPIVRQTLATTTITVATTIQLVIILLVLVIVIVRRRKYYQYDHYRRRPPQSSLKQYPHLYQHLVPPLTPSPPPMQLLLAHRFRWAVYVQQLLLWTLNLHRKHIRPNINLMIVY